MWKLFQRNQAPRGMVKISAWDLSVLLKSLGGRLIVFDLRGPDEAEQYPYIIPGALLTTETELAALIGWLPPSTPIVLYAMDRIPQSCSQLGLLRNDLSFYTLIGGLRAWWDADLEMDSVERYAGGLRARD